jgi:hypothetical protein
MFSVIFVFLTVGAGLFLLAISAKESDQRVLRRRLEYFLRSVNYSA